MIYVYTHFHQRLLTFHYLIFFNEKVPKTDKLKLVSASLPLIFANANNLNRISLKVLN